MLWAFFLGAALATTNTDQITLKYAQAVEIEEPFTYTWSAEQAQISKATVLVLEVSDEKIGLPQVAMPVLYVGGSPAARVHPGSAEHHIVVYVAGYPDLTAVPIFWGPDELPERVTKDMGLHYAATTTARPLSATVVAAVEHPNVTVANEAGLMRLMSDLIGAYAPGDKRYAEGIRVTMQP